MDEKIPGEDGSVAILCPSLGKACGIARYATYVADSIAKSGRPVSLLRRSAELFLPDARRFRTVIVQHEYGLLDSLSPLGTGETTSELLANLVRYADEGKDVRTAIVMHTIATHDHVLNAMNSQIFSSPVPVFHLNSKGAYEFGIPYLEHGVYAYPAPPRSKPIWETEGEEIPRVMGSFGLLSPNKRPTQLITICARSASDFLGNFATNDKGLVKTVLQNARSSGVKAEIHSDFCSEDELLLRLSGATFAAVAQEGIGHFATSGSLRFLFNLGIPVLAPYVPQFADCEDGVIFVHPDRMHRTIQILTSDPRLYREAAERAMRFLDRNEMGAVYGRLLDLLHATPAHELVAYRKRNFRELNADVPHLTLADMLIRSIGAQETGGEEAAEAIVVGALGAEEPERSAALLDRVPPAGPIDLRVGLDRVASPLLQARERAILIGSERFISRNLRKLGDHLAINDTIEAKAREELLRLVRAANEERSELLERRDAIRLLSGSALQALRPDVYPADIGGIADRLRWLTQLYGDERGFARRTRAAASVPVLLSMPAGQVLSYLLHVGGLEAGEILAIVGTLGLPTDQLSERTAWVRGLEEAYPSRPGIALLRWRPDPRDLRSRTRFFRTEFACLTEREFALAAWEVFQLQSLPGPEMDRLRRSMRRDGRRAALQQLCATVAGLYDIAIIDSKDASPNLIDRVDRIATVSRPHDDMRQMFLEPPDFEYLNRAEKAEGLDWLADVGPNDLFVSPLEGDAAKRPVHTLPPPLLATLAAGGGALDDVARIGWSLLSAADEAGCVRAESWTREASSDGWSYFRRASQHGADIGGGLPDQKWEEAWSAVARHPGGHVIGPEEMRGVSPRVVPMHFASGVSDIDFVILHKGRHVEYERFVAEMVPEEWHISYANEVFLVFARRIYATEAFNPGFVPRQFRRYLRLTNVGLSTLLVKLGKRARIG